MLIDHLISIATGYIQIFEVFKFHGWHKLNIFCNFIFEDPLSITNLRKFVLMPEWIQKHGEPS